jgi:large subunit ribosomal protein L10
MDNPRPDKVKVVNEVRELLDGCDAAVLTEYRGLGMKQLSELRRTLKPQGGEYRVFKNTLVRIATNGVGIDADSMLTGPTGIAFVKGDAAAVAKTLRDYAKTNQNLVIKGGILGNQVLSGKEVESLADLPSRDVLLSQIAGLFEAPASQFASLLEAVPKSFLYGVQALIEKQEAAA